MKQIISLTFSVFFILSFFSNVSAIDFKGGYCDIPEPTLTYPLGEEVVLSGGDPLIFKWCNNKISWIDHYEFKLYKGYNTYSAGLILKENISSNENSFSVKSDLFEDGQIYTWALKQVADNGVKSSPCSNSFKIIKK